MKSYNQVMDETERATMKNHELISMKIIEEVESYYKIKFPIEENNLTYSLLIQLILFDPSFVEYRSKLFGVFEKYNINEENIISRFLITINQVGIPILLKYFMEESLRKFPCCKSFKKFNNGYVIETKNGVVEAYQLSKLIDDKNLCALLNENILRKHCHEAVQICSKYFPDGMIITSELNSLFEGTYYHSYFKGESKEDVYDVSTNTLYKGNTFDTFYKPRELQSIPSSKLDEQIKRLPEEQNENHCKVLRLAIENKIKMERES